MPDSARSEISSCAGPQGKCSAQSHSPPGEYYAPIVPESVRLPTLPGHKAPASPQRLGLSVRRRCSPGMLTACKRSPRVQSAFVKVLYCGGCDSFVFPSNGSLDESWSACVGVAFFYFFGLCFSGLLWRGKTTLIPSRSSLRTTFSNCAVPGRLFSSEALIESSTTTIR
jgi:hypothetical protein